MLSRVFGKGSIYETLDLDDRRDDEHPDMTFTTAV
jgi:hypothetical protein